MVVRSTFYCQGFVRNISQGEAIRIAIDGPELTLVNFDRNDWTFLSRKPSHFNVNTKYTYLVHVAMADIILNNINYI